MTCKELVRELSEIGNYLSCNDWPNAQEIIAEATQIIEDWDFRLKLAKNLGK